MRNKLMVFERKITRKISGPPKSDDGYWKIKTNQEINDLLKGQNTIGFVKKESLNWLGHVERMAEDNDVQKIKRWKPMSKRPIGRLKTLWEDDVLEDMSMNVRNWKNVAQNRDSWKKVAWQARTLYRL
jgi:hypothetical protein